jgi:hypothetical protein
MIMPSVHFNGTSREQLLETYERAVKAVHTAHQALVSAYPNGRDYYPQGAIVIYTAVDEHLHRVELLKSVKHELEQIIQHITEAE